MMIILLFAFSRLIFEHICFHLGANKTSFIEMLLQRYISMGGMRYENKNIMPG